MRTRSPPAIPYTISSLMRSATDAPSYRCWIRENHRPSRLRQAPSRARDAGGTATLPSQQHRHRHRVLDGAPEEQSRPVFGQGLHPFQQLLVALPRLTDLLQELGVEVLELLEVLPVLRVGVHREFR